MYKTSNALLLAGALSSVASALNHIAVKSQNFVDSVTGDRFDIIGVDYQPGGESGYKPDSGVDPLSDPATCLRDAVLLQMLGVNTIRSYNIDPDINHDECASIFNAAGIYMMLDVNDPLYDGSINRADPGPSYNMNYLNRTFALIDAFRNYDNTLGFFSANELVNDNGGGNALTDPPYIRAVTRDLKAYLKARGGRQIPIGYATTDNDKIIMDMINYIQCVNPTEDSRSDFFGLNDYQWCGDEANFQTSGYATLIEQFANITMPPFFSEYGCNNVLVNGARTFPEVPVLYSNQMTVMSGGLIYQWTEDVSNYGLVNISDDNVLTLRQDYNNLRQRFAKIDRKAVSTRNNTATALVPPTCSEGLIKNPKLFSNEFNLPAQPKGVAALIKNGVNGNIGKMVAVTNTVVNMKVLNTTGTQITGLKLNSDGTATSSGASPTNTHNAAVRNVGSLAPAVGLIGLLTMFLA